MTATLTFDIDTTDFDILRDRTTRLYDEVLTADTDLWNMLEPIELRGDLVPVSQTATLHIVPVIDPAAMDDGFLELLPEVVSIERAA